jgi:tetratricopeptide (TPR) repeat protein
MAFLRLYSGGQFFYRWKRDRENIGGTFSRELQRYDAILAEGRALNPDELGPLLDRLEQNALGVESHLSVLKRRRNLALNHGSVKAYGEAARRAAAAFPFSEPLAAVAAEALILEEPQIDDDRKVPLRQYGELLSEPRFLPLALGLYILAGDMQDPSGAAAIPRGKVLLDSAISLFRGERQAEFLIDACILRLPDDPEGAGALIISLLQNPEAPEKAYRFAAEFFYDHGNPLRAAEIFSRFSDEESLLRQADALWLAGFPEGARAIWTALVSPDHEGQFLLRPQAGGRILYNLAVLAADREEKLGYLEKLFIRDPGHPYGLIAYSRLFDTPKAAVILTEMNPRQEDPLSDLELLRRRQDEWGIAKTIAETWLLLGRHPEDGRLYQWGAYYFDRQRQYGETALLIQTCRLKQLGGAWLDFHEALGFIREGRIEEGETILQTLSQDNAVWQIPANIARILESRRSTAAALAYYETAATLVKAPQDASKIQVRIAHCLRVLGRDQESRRVLEYALDLDPENLKARLELQRPEP